jgi:hypothetical protein
LRVTAHHDRTASGTAGSITHLRLGDPAVLSLIGGEEIIQRAQPPVMISLQLQRIIHPRAHALRLPAGNRVLGHRNQASIHRR